jgi:hypothetical protein
VNERQLKFPSGNDRQRAKWVYIFPLYFSTLSADLLAQTITARNLKKLPDCIRYGTLYPSLILSVNLSNHKGGTYENVTSRYKIHGLSENERWKKIRPRITDWS